MNEEINIEIVDEDQVNVSTNDGWHELPYEEKDPLFKESPAYTISNEDINNWNNKVTDNDYVHTDNNFTTEEKTKLSTLENYDDSEIQEDISDLETNKADKTELPTNTSELTNDSGFITNSVNNLTNYTLKTNTGSLVDLEINTTNYVVTLNLKNQDGTIISTDTIDLPLESVVVGGSYDSVNKKVVLTLENGNTVEFSVADLVAGLQTELSSTNKLNADYVDDTNSGNKFVTTSEKTTWNAKLDSSDLTGYVKNIDYANATTGGVIKTGYYSVLINNYGNLYADTKTYESYQTVGNEHFISKGTLENVLTARIGDISSTLDLINGEVV